VVYGTVIRSTRRRTKKERKKERERERERERSTKCSYTSVACLVGRTERLWLQRNKILNCFKIV
jgi:hypothetical protein